MNLKHRLITHISGLIQGDQIASLYDLLTFEDKPVARSVVTEKDSKKSGSAGLERTRPNGSRKRRVT
jgi:hypothetical protein